jgi:hypothetical protein
MIQYLNTPGQHALLFGNRGVGKSSLASITSKLLMENMGYEVVRKQCDSNDDFLTIVGEILSKAGIDIYQTRKVKNKSSGVEKVVKFTGSNTEENLGYIDKAKSPSWVASKVHNISAIYLIDEIDALESKEDKQQLAEFVKQLSDQGSKLKVLLVGIAEDSGELTVGHQSIARCMKEIKLGNLYPEELQEILQSGEKSLGMKFKKDVLKNIVSLSSGYPHFTHLLGLKAAEKAIVEEKENITQQHLRDALEDAISDAEGNLREKYQKAIRSSVGEYKKVLLACSLCPNNEIVTNDIRNKYYELYGNTISQQSLNNYFQRLVSKNDDRIGILKRIKKGIYKFNDPRMPSYIKIAQNYIE